MPKPPDRTALEGCGSVSRLGVRFPWFGSSASISPLGQKISSAGLFGKRQGIAENGYRRFIDTGSCRFI